MCPEGGLRADAQANRQAVIDSAIDILTRNEDASMQEIADHSGVGRTTVYRHFPSRENLLETLMGEVMTRSTAEIEKITATGMDPASTMRAVARRNVELGVRFRFLYDHQEVTKPVIQARTRDGDTAMSGYLESAQRRGEIIDGLTVAWITATLMSLSMAMVAEVLAGRIEREEAGEILGETLVAVIGDSA